MIMMRTLYRDLQRYNRIPTDEEKAEEQEESGWKLVHADVFRAPPASMLFSVMVGTGVQCFGSAMGILTFSALGFLSPANRGSLLTALVVVFVIMGMVGGYHAARMYKTFKGTAWQCVTLLTAFGFPGVHPSDLGTIMDQYGVAVRTGHHCTQPLMELFKVSGTTRASFAFYNNDDDVYRLKAAILKAKEFLL